MKYFRNLLKILCVVILINLSHCARKVNKFPPEFEFGAATASYQIEGGWNEDGKTPSIWDTFTHDHPDQIKDQSTGDVTADSYHRFDEDLKAIKKMGLDFYRFSISWNRILPNGDLSNINEAGIKYYNMIINKLIENNVKPMVTMYHWDLPQKLQTLGGLTNPIIINYFEDYADILYKYFGDRVTHWITFNEPSVYCVEGYGGVAKAPASNYSGIADYLCIDNTIKSHAKAYHLYKAKYSHYVGKVGITVNSFYYLSKSNDNNLINRALQFHLGWIVHPIFSSAGDYPEIMIKEISKNSNKAGFQRSRLPVLTPEWKNVLKGAGDFLGLNYYTSRYAELGDGSCNTSPSWECDSKLVLTTDPQWKRAKSDWLFSVPKGLEELLKFIRDEYNNVEVIITENGWSDDGQLDDNDRIDYLKDHLKSVLIAINDGCNVTGYTAWSLIDNFEWLLGFTEKFGLYGVNFTSPNKERSPKKSSLYYKSITESHSID